MGGLVYGVFRVVSGLLWWVLWLMSFDGFWCLIDFGWCCVLASVCFALVLDDLVLVALCSVCLMCFVGFGFLGFAFGFCGIAFGFPSFAFVLVGLW